jgi:chromosome transmission fidelity protein 4
VIEVTDQDLHNIVNIEFHDRSARKAYHFQDTYKYDMASLGECGILYSCGPDASHPARIEYRPYSTWASSADWSFDFPEGEKPVALAAGGIKTAKHLEGDDDVEDGGTAIVGTNRGYLRFFSGGGLQRYVWFVGEDIVSMAAGREWVFIVHRDGGASLDGASDCLLGNIG